MLMLFIECELSLAQLVMLLMVEPTHSDSSPRLDRVARIFLNLFHYVTVLCFQQLEMCRHSLSVVIIDIVVGFAYMRS